MNHDVDARDKCAACKYQRKRCDENCPLAPYFPSNKVQEFQKVIRLFRISNIIKMLNSVVDNEKRAKMAETLMCEANIRYENPVHGCVAVERKLKLEIEETKKELDFVQKKIAFYKELRERSSSNKVVETSKPAGEVIEIKISF
ncbi:LOB domain-containing protein 24-like isoform X2 [Solanum dulcamara]|uniref:LOB domain-containing protein 24-like isoform X2 n=1 Tax=Solanum dulcamara TaxID=45834 RepID=UPI002485B090|nr:LOB domain-containing protein 24-like isoform X2 [Solanum dulcamara]XP_055812630.1 LOB domain-containing protein 24-like isoform X2 [Solanum dulcamara]